ncbi:MAG TPA: hypothetical protein VGH73_22285 [Thermoanaerobaculia bacterium]
MAKSVPWRLLPPFLILAAAGLPSFSGMAGAGQIELISRAYHVATYGVPASLPAMSADGRYVVFASNAPDLAPRQVDHNNAPDLFLRDRAAGTTTLITHAAGSPETAASYADFKAFVEGQISPDGRYVAYASAAVDLVPGMTGAGFLNVFLWDRVTGATTLVSHAAGRTTAAADGSSSPAAVTADGDVLFTSLADDLVERPTASRGPGGRPASHLFLWRRSSDTLTLVSARNGSSSIPANGSSEKAAISADGDSIVFLSAATDLGPDPDGSGKRLGNNVFLYDRSAGAVSPLTTAGDASGSVAISADGRWIAFTLEGEEHEDVFLYDRGSGETRLVSHRSGSPQARAGGGSWMVMSADGRAVAFTSAATDLVAGQRDANGQDDLFVYDRDSGETSLVTHVPGSPSTAPADTGYLELWSVSAGGRFIAFASDSSHLVPGQTGASGGRQVFLYDRVSGSLALASHGRESLTWESKGRAEFPFVSADGSAVIFQSSAPNLGDGPAEPNGYDGFFVYDRISREVSPLAPTDPDLSSLTPNGPSSTGDISADGRLVAFVSEAEGVTSGQVQWKGRSWNVFLHDRSTGETRLMSQPGTPWDNGRGLGGISPVLSADGRFLACVTLTDATGVSGLLLHDLTRTAVPPVPAAAPVLVNHGPRTPRRIVGSVRDPAISADGRYVAYVCKGCPPDPEKGSGIFLYDRAAGTSIRVSRAAGGVESPRISADGRFVVFLGGTPRQVFLFDRTTGAVTPVSAVGRSAAGNAGISADGRWIFFRGGAADLFLYDRGSGRAVRVGSSAAGDDSASISADGRWLVYLSAATDLLLYDRVTGASSLVSHASGSAAAANRPPESPRISADGRRIAFLSAATDLMAGQTGGEGIVRLVLQDRATGARTLVGRVRAAGPPASPVPAEISFPPRMSADGRQIAFTTDAADLLPGDRNGTWDVYLYEAAVPGPPG